MRKSNEAIWLFWVHAATKARVEEGIKAIADAVKIPGREKSDADILHLVERWLSNERNGKWVIVLDSADDINLFYNTDGEPRRPAPAEEAKRPLWTYLPQSANGSILVTTRNRELAFNLTGNHKNIIDIGPMDPDQALMLLSTKCGVEPDTDAGQELVKALECIPLAITQAAAYIQQRKPRTSVRKYLDQFRKSEKNKYSLLNYAGGDLRRDRSAANSIITTCQISFDQICSEKPSATDLLSLMSFFDRQGIPESLIQPLGKSEEANNEEQLRDESSSPGENSNELFEDDITTLTKYCLVNVNETGDTFEMHGLVQLSARLWLDARGKSEEFKESYISRMAQAFPTGDFSNWEMCRKLFPHAEGILSHRPTNEASLEEWASILYNCAWYALEQGIYSTARNMAREALAVREKMLGKQNQLTLSTSSILGKILCAAGDYGEAESRFLCIMETTKTLLGAKHSDTLTAMSNLASTYMLQGRWKEAESLQMQVVELRTTVLGATHPDVPTAMCNLAFTWKTSGRVEDAINLLEECVQVRIRVLGPEHPNTKNSQSALDSWYTEKLEDSEQPLGNLGQRSLAGKLRRLGWRWKMTLRKL